MIFDEISGPMLKFSQYWGYKVVKNDNLYFCFGALDNIFKKIHIIGLEDDMYLLKNKYNLPHSGHFYGANYGANLNLNEFDKFLKKKLCKKDESRLILYDILTKSSKYAGYRIPKELLFDMLPAEIKQIIIFNIDEWNAL